MLTGLRSAAGSPRTRTQAARAVSTQSGRRPLFNRDLEKEKLTNALQRSPSSIRLILGPRNCGKSAVLQSVVQDRRHAVYIDCRGIDSSSPTTWINGLLQQLLPLAPSTLRAKLKELLLAFPAGAKLSDKGWSWSPNDVLMRLLFPNKTDAPAGLNNVINTLEEVFAAWGKEDQQNCRETTWPVLVIDEANKLMAWSDTYPAELNSLLSFFVKITKQEQQCHVVMASSEFGLQTWLSNAIGQEFWLPEVIGDFPQNEARQFLGQLLGAMTTDNGSSIDKDDVAWAAVWEVCGGNPGALVRLSDQLQERKGRDWKAALMALWRIELVKVERLLLGGQGFTPVQYAAAALKLLESELNPKAVGLRDMNKLLGKYAERSASSGSAEAAGATVLQQLVQTNALSVRPQSDWARDIPVQAFNSPALVTAPSTMNLYCLEHVKTELQEILKEYNSMQNAQQANPR